MKALLALPVGLLVLGGYVYAGTHLAGAAHQNYKAIQGNGKLKVENRNVAPYTKIVIGSAFEGQFFETTPGPLSISADSNVLPLIETKVVNGTLIVNVKGSISTKNGFKITGRTAKISALRASGAANIELKNIGKHALEIEGDGAAKVNVFGSPTSLKADASGASQLTFGTLTLDTLVADLSGASKLTLSGTVKTATVEASGASNFDGKLSGNKFKATASGASNVNVSGHFNTSTTSASGAANISRPY